MAAHRQAAHVPTGSIPRTMTVHVRGEATRAAAPGDVVTITGLYTLYINKCIFIHASIY
jgi:DNA replicative helicase MCM subunit Mcm2 (Cdc46/Mcm family)